MWLTVRTTICAGLELEERQNKHIGHTYSPGSQILLLRDSLAPAFNSHAVQRRALLRPVRREGVGPKQCPAGLQRSSKRGEKGQKEQRSVRWNHNTTHNALMTPNSQSQQLSASAPKGISQRHDPVSTHVHHGMEFGIGLLCIRRLVCICISPLSRFQRLLVGHSACAETSNKQMHSQFSPSRPFSRP